MRLLKPIHALSLLVLATVALEPVIAQRGLREAIESHRAQVAEQPDDATLITDLGNLLVLAGEMTEAEEVYRRAIQLDETLVTPHYNLALLLHQTGRRKAARREQQKVLDLEPDHAWARYQLGTLAAESGARARAIEHYAMAFSLDRRLTEPEYNPHILDNELSVPAVMKAHGTSSSAALAPRQYEQPKRITRLLVPGLTDVERRQLSDETPDTPGPAPTTSDEAGRVERREGPAEGPFLLPSGDSEDSATMAAPEPRQETSSERGRSPRRPGAQPSTQAPSPKTPGAIRAAPPTSSPPARAQPPRATPQRRETESPESRPDLPSSGQLGLRIVPSTAAPSETNG